MTNAESDHEFPCLLVQGQSTRTSTMMTAAQCHPRAPRVGRPVQRGSVEAELCARFEREAVPLRDVLYRHASLDEPESCGR